MRDAEWQAGASIAAEPDFLLGNNLPVLVGRADHWADAVMDTPAFPEMAEAAPDQHQRRGEPPLDLVIFGAAFFVFAIIGLRHRSPLSVGGRSAPLVLERFSKFRPGHVECLELIFYK
jgi:hypothetical protein